MATSQRTFSDWLRVRFQGVTTRAGAFGVRLGLSPDVVTVAGLLLVVLAAGFVAAGQFLVAGIILILGMPLDAWDGAIARALNRQSRFGALLDSTLDRYADGFILLGVMVWYSGRGQQAELIIAGLALIGGFLVSYVRARAEGLGIACKDGLFSRMERTIVTLIMLLTGWVTLGALILAVGSNFTAVQRIALVWRATRNDP